MEHPIASDASVTGTRVHVVVARRQVSCQANDYGQWKDDCRWYVMTSSISSDKEPHIVLDLGPLLSLMLGDGRSLVTQVVPPALLEFSRSVMRSTFSSIMHKRIYTLSFDRTSTADEALFNKLEHARRNRGVVISTPTSIKSIMLKFIEHLHTLNEPSMVSPPGTAKQVECLSRILGLFRNGTLVMDEVDLLLHPLKSELNFRMSTHRTCNIRSFA